MKLVFFGTGVVAAPALERLCDSPHAIVACVTQPDRAQGRGLQARPSPVKHIAATRAVRCMQSARLDAAAAEALRPLQPDVGVVVDYGLRIPPEFLTLPRLGMLGIHPSLLPQYRGAAPIQWAILRGEAVTGATIFRVTDAWDSGDILLQDMTAIRPEETAVELRDRLAHQGAELLVRALDVLERGAVQWHSQDAAAATQAPKLTKADGKIDWAQPAPLIVNRIRGLQPWPGAFTDCKGKTLKLWRARVGVGCAAAAPGTVVQLTDEGFVVSAGAGGVLVTSVQPAGGRAMEASAFCRGHALRSGDRLT